MGINKRAEYYLVKFFMRIFIHYRGHERCHEDKELILFTFFSVLFCFICIAFYL